MLTRHINEFDRVVAVGGGHGLGRVLSSLSFLGPRLTGVVTTTDNGGSTGRLRNSENCIAWGDMRNCINQLITEPSIGSLLFEYRFRGSGEIGGHNLGNLMLLALDNLCVRPLEAINLIRSMLKVDCYIVPMAEQPADLLAVSQCGEKIHGEMMVDQMTQFPDQLKVHPQVPATQEAIQAIEQADLLLLGPGSFLTSVMPPLLLPALQGALRRTRAKVIFIANLAAEPGPASTFSLEQQLSWCQQQVGFSFIDAVLTSLEHTATTEHPKFFKFDLGEANQPHRHDRSKLANALSTIITAL